MRARLIVAAAILLSGIAVGALIARDDEPARFEIAPAASVQGTGPPTQPPLTLAPGFEGYRPGDPLPEPPPMPADTSAPVPTVPGPYGPIYPDGYVAPEHQGSAPRPPVSTPPSTVDNTMPTR